jgi:hypothetical protein
MTKDEFDVIAKQLWDDATSRPYSPAWEELGEVTQQVWRERAAEYLEKKHGQKPEVPR